MFGLTKLRYEKDKIEVYINPPSLEEKIYFFIKSRYRYLLLDFLSFFQSGGPRGEGLQTAITPELLIFALAFSIIIGMIAGVIPAYRASNLNPVDALRNQ